MQIKKTTNSSTNVTLSIIAKSDDLLAIKEKTLSRLSDKVKLAGFRGGKAPLALIEKNLDPNLLQTEFMDDALQELYVAAVNEEKLRVAARPEVALKKFVPFSELEFDVTVDVVGKVTLGDYKKLKAKKSEVTVTAKDVDDVIEALRQRSAEKKDVTRAAKLSDQVWIDFEGKDSKGKAVAGADGKDYPIILGSNTFIPGFEENVLGLKAGQSKEFTVTFPKDYRIAALQSKKVTFTVTVKKVQSVTLPKVDDEFAKSAGPVQDLKQLKEDIKKELTIERETQAQRDYEGMLLQDLTSKSEADVPKSLLEEQIDRLVQDTKQNLMYRGQTWPEFLSSEGKTEEEYRKTLEAPARERVKAGMILSEVAEQEKIEISPEEFEVRVQILKSQYTDDKMREELDKPENRRDLASRMMTEKTIAKLVSFAKPKG